MLYRAVGDEPLPGTTYYGDLGIDLARCILASPKLACHLNDMIPENQGRATVYGLTLHNTEISGSTIFLSSEDLLPMRDLPIVARVSVDSDITQIRRAVALIAASSTGGCIQVMSSNANLTSVKSFGQNILKVIRESTLKNPVVLLVPDNYGQVLGNYASNWRRETFALIVIDEIPDRQAHFVNIGRKHNNIVPASFYGAR